MKLSWITRSLQASAVTAAMLLVMPAGAQTPAPNTPAPTAAPAAQATPTTPRLQNRPHRAERRAPRHTPAQRHNQRSRSGEPANANRLATDRGATMTDYQRNAFARCDVFKTPEDRKACMERLRQTPQGSVQEGGLLWEYSYQVPADGS